MCLKEHSYTVVSVLHSVTTELHRFNRADQRAKKIRDEEDEVYLARKEGRGVESEKEPCQNANKKRPGDLCLTVDPYDSAGTHTHTLNVSLFRCAAPPQDSETPHWAQRETHSSLSLYPCFVSWSFDYPHCFIFGVVTSPTIALRLVIFPMSCGDVGC